MRLFYQKSIIYLNFYHSRDTPNTSEINNQQSTITFSSALVLVFGIRQDTNLEEIFYKSKYIIKIIFLINTSCEL